MVLLEVPLPERRELSRRQSAVPCLITISVPLSRGESYFNEAAGTANGFDSMRGRFMDRVRAATSVTERFTARDLRAKAGSDAEGLERARALSQHADAQHNLGEMYVMGEGVPTESSVNPVIGRYRWSVRSHASSGIP